MVQSSSMSFEKFPRRKMKIRQKNNLWFLKVATYPPAIKWIIESRSVILFGTALNFSFYYYIFVSLFIVWVYLLSLSLWISLTSSPVVYSLIALIYFNNHCQLMTFVNTKLFSAVLTIRKNIPPGCSSIAYNAIFWFFLYVLLYCDKCLSHKFIFFRFSLLRRDKN